MSEVKRYDGKIKHVGDGGYVSYKDYAELKAQRDALAAENAVIRAGIPEERFIDIMNENMDDVSLAEGIGYNTAVKEMRRDIKTPATDAYLNSVRAEMIPEGYVIVPQQMHLSADAMESLCFHCGDGGFAFGDFTDGLLWVGNIENDDGTKTYGLNIATAEYPEEGSATISELSAQLRAGEPS